MARVKEAKAPLEPKGTTLPELVKELKQASTKRKKFEEQAEEQKSLIHKIAVIKIPPLMEALEQDEFNVPGIGRVELGIELYPYVKKDDEPTFFEWLEDNGSGAIIKRTIHPQTLKAWVGEQIDDPEKAGLLPKVLTVTKIPTAKLLKERKRR